LCLLEIFLDHFVVSGSVQDGFDKIRKDYRFDDGIIVD
jgi:hypothetical protein